MKSQRLEQLADGIFAIVMTLLVIDLKLPNTLGGLSNTNLFLEIQKLEHHFYAYVLSFLLLFTYWRAHHFFISVYAKNLDSRLININTIFFMLISLVPFSTSVLSRFSGNEFAIALFGVHIILIGLTIYWMRNYVFYSPHIKNPEITKHEIYGSTLRILTPVIASVLAIYISLFNTTLSLTIFTLAVIFNLSSLSTKLFQRFF